MKKKCILFVVLVLMLSCCSFSVSAADGPAVERVTRISDGGLMIEFSEDVVIDGRNPFFGVRVLDKKGNLLYVEGVPKQFYNFDFTVVDGRTILLTTADSYGKKMMSKTGEFAFYKDCTIMFCIEELFPEGVSARGDGTVYNIKSRATGQRLAAQYGGPNGYDGCYYPIVKDYTHLGEGDATTDNMDDPSVQKPAQDETPKNPAYNIFVPNDVKSVYNDAAVVIHEGRNDNIIWLGIGVAGAAIIGAIAVLIVVLVRNKSKRHGDVK